jgi:DNA-directed RNA polymerase subunit RPC12/RpoP
MELATEIICVDCGGQAHLITPVPAEEELEPGDVLVYRCADCMDRWDIVFERDDIEETL